jgi:hypothetical protein
MTTTRPTRSQWKDRTRTPATYTGVFMHLEARQETTAGQLLKIINSVVTDYRTDIDHDREQIDARPGMPFIHSAYKYGTHLYFMRPAEDPSWPAPGESVPYLFGRCTRERILENEKTAVDWIASPARDATTVLHHFDGRKLHKVTPDQARELWANYTRRTASAWTREAYAAAGQPFTN